MKTSSAITPPLLLKVLAVVCLAAGLTSCSSMKVQNDWDKKMLADFPPKGP
ncbi:MAG: hypothetical protein K8R59_14645 [Thermoanaerobaculales bacterium]|nr:hypothetical protein [Thermoanaerobaculales bacterium]